MITVHTRKVAGVSLIVLALAGCGAIAPETPDAGEPVNRRLEILGPPGDSIGLAYGERETLRVRYVSGQGEVIPGAAVSFTMIETGLGESTAGSTLSAAMAHTDETGIAQVDLTAGTQNASFRVRVDARDAPTQHFYISISNGGFARLELTPVHEGWREPDEDTRVEVRLYRAVMVSCSEVDIDALPVSVLPARTLSGFAQTASYPNVPAGVAHTVVAWSRRVNGEVPLAVGCADLGPGQLPSSRVLLTLPVSDRDLVLGEALGWRFDLGPVAAALEAQGTARPWQILGCEAGPGQLLLDCALDALAPDGALDCDVRGSAALIDALEPTRAPPGASGCRPAVLASLQPSLDAELTAAVAAGRGFPVGGALSALLAARGDVLAGFVLGAELAVPADGSAASHRLISLGVSSGEEEHTLELATTSRPVIEQRGMEARLQGNELVLGAHGFTLRYGAFAADAFAALGLGPAGLGEHAEALGAALAASVRDGQAEGCSAMSALVCRRASRPDDCLRAACVQGAAALDAGMTAWWRALQAPGIDLSIVGHGALRDDDGDRVADAVGSTDGAWSATLWLSDGTSVAVPGALWPSAE